VSEASERPESRLPYLWLSLCAAAGLALAAFGLLRSERDGALPEGAVARVNQAVIRGEGYEQLLAALARDRRGELTQADQRHVLDRMIDEELLVQRGLELGLAQLDRRVRADLVGAVIASVTADAERRAPTEEDLRALYREEPGFFEHPGRLRVRQIFFRAGTADDEATALRRASAAKQRLLAGESFDVVKRSAGDAEIVPVPDGLLPAAKLREYIGPSAVRAALDLEVGAVSEPLRSGEGIRVVEVVQHEPARTPSFEEIEPQVRAEWVRRAGDRALRAYLDELRGRADVVVVPSLR
jgi:parvulin-like peptidyl-prolyl isomerase